MQREERKVAAVEMMPALRIRSTKDPGASLPMLTIGGLEPQTRFLSSDARK